MQNNREKENMNREKTGTTEATEEVCMSKTQL